MSCNTSENFILKSGLEVADSATFNGVVDISNLSVSDINGIGFPDSAGGSGDVLISDGTSSLTYRDVSSLLFNAINGSSNSNYILKTDGSGSMEYVSLINLLVQLVGNYDSGDIIKIDGSGNLDFDSIINILLSALGGNGNPDQVIKTDGSGNLSYADLEDILGYRFNLGSGAEDGDLLIYDSANEEFRLSRISEQHIINGGQY